MIGDGGGSEKALGGITIAHGSGAYKFSHDSSRRRLHAWDDVGVLLERERGRLVTEPLAYDLDRHARLQRKRRVGVAEIV